MPRSAPGSGLFSVRNCACGAAICVCWSAAGAAAAIGGAFGAPLAGAFYAFELILGNYSIASAGPILTGSIVGVLFTRLMAGAPYQIDTPPVAALTLANYPVLLGIAVVSVAHRRDRDASVRRVRTLRPGHADSRLGAAGPRRSRRRRPRRDHAANSWRRPWRARA